MNPVIKTTLLDVIREVEGQTGQYRQWAQALARMENESDTPIEVPDQNPTARVVRFTTPITKTSTFLFALIIRQHGEWKPHSIVSSQPDSFARILRQYFQARCAEVR